jgi:hypothetical protein
MNEINDIENQMWGKQLWGDMGKTDYLHLCHFSSFTTEENKSLKLGT